MPVALGVYVTEQVDEAPVPGDSEHVPPVPKVPVPVDVSVTTPVGAVGAFEVSVTVTRQLVDTATASVDGVQATPVVVGSGVLETTFNEAWPLLEAHPGLASAPG